MEESILNEPAEQPKFGWRDKIGYALGDFGCNLSFSLIGTYMADFYTQFIGLADWQWMTIIVLTKIWDGINDPIMGALMDVKRIGNGASKFKPWIRIGSIGLIFTCALVFLPIPVQAGRNGILQMIICMLTYLMWDICYTLVNVPYGSLNSAISGDPAERTSLSTWRTIGAALGGALCMVLPYLLYEGSGESRNLLGGRLIWIALVMGVMAYVAYRYCLKMTVERFEVPSEKVQKLDVKRTLKAFIHNRPLLAMSLASMAQIIFFSSIMSTVKWLAQVYFSGDADDTIFLVTIISYIPMVIALPFVGKLVKKFGKKLTAGLPFILSIIATVVLLLVPMKPFETRSTVIFIAGLAAIQLGGGTFQVICWAMITDCIDYQQLKSGDRLEGSVYAMYSMFRKIAQGVALSLPLMCMTRIAGYNAKPESGNIIDQAAGVPERMMTVSLMLVLIGSVLMAVSLLFVYNLGKKEVEEMNIQLGKTPSKGDVAEQNG